MSYGDREQFWRELSGDPKAPGQRRGMYETLGYSRFEWYVLSALSALLLFFLLAPLWLIHKVWKVATT